MEKLIAIFGIIVLVVTLLLGSAVPGGRPEDPTAEDPGTSEAEPGTDSPEDPTEEPSTEYDSYAFITLENFGREVEGNVRVAVRAITREANTAISALGRTYDSYEEHRDALDAWYAYAVETSEMLYRTVSDEAIAAYRRVSAETADRDYDWDGALEELYASWDEALDEYYDAWEEVYDTVYDKWDGILGDEDDGDPDAWNEANKAHSASRRAMNDAYWNAWRAMTDEYKTVWRGFLSGDYDVDKLIRLARYGAEEEEPSSTEAEPEP